MFIVDTAARNNYNDKCSIVTVYLNTDSLYTFYSDLTAKKGGIIVNNNSSGFVKATARLLVALLIMCLSLTALPLLSPAALPVAQAANITYSVPAGTGVDAINNQLNTYASGSVVDVILNGNVDFKSKGFDTNQQSIGIVIPNGLTVNLYMSGHSITSIRNSKGDGASWQQQGIMAIVNNGTLNIYSGSSAASPVNNSGSTISVVNIYESMEAGENEEKAYGRCDAIVNNGTLTVNKNVNLNAKSSLKYSKNKTYCAGSTLSTATGVYNATPGASCTLNSATITATALSQSFPAEVWTTAKTRADAWGISYGVYGGNVNVVGSTSISVEGTSCAYREGGAYSHKCEQLCVAYDICTSGKIRIDGGTFNYSTNSTYEEKCSDDGKQLLLTGNILTTSSNTPVITDGNFNVATVSQFGNVSHPTYSEGNIASVSTLPLSGAEYMANGDIRNGMEKSGSNGSLYPNTTISGAVYVDESGNHYTGQAVSDRNSHPKAITRGAPSGKVRVHIVYRFWANSNRTEEYKVENSSGENLAYTFNPTTDGTGIVTSPVVLNGVDTSTFTVSTGAKISLKNAGSVVNGAYWEFKGLYYMTTPPASHSDFKPMAQKGSELPSPYTVQSSPVYIFCDFCLKDPSVIVASVGSANSVTLTYKGMPVKASECGLKIYEGYDVQTDVTADYSIDRNDSSLISVDYHWERTDASGTDTSGEHTLPENVGTYLVTLTVKADGAFDPNNCDPKLYKNRVSANGGGDLVYTFNLTIVPANVTRGTLPENIELTYGQTIAEALKLTAYAAGGVNGKTPTGTFVFASATDGSTIKPAGSAAVTVRWLAGDISNGSQNYKNTDFTVNCTIKQKTLTLAPLSAEIVYGASEFTTPFELSYSGLIPQDDIASVKAAIKSVIKFSVFLNTYYVDYVPGSFPAGEHNITIMRNTGVAEPAVLNNYKLELDTTGGAKLKVTQAGLTVKATAVSREYDPTSNTVTVKFDITSGKFISDAITVASVSGYLSDNHAGTRNVDISTAALEIVGAKSASYKIENVEYATGDILTAEITKAVPVVTVPSQKSGYYRTKATLNADYSLDDAALPAGIEGAWRWAEGDKTPTVAVQSYQAEFVPVDTENYSVKAVDVKIVITPTPVTVTFEGSVEYGDPIPTITDLTYKSVYDPDFDIDDEKIKLTGNIIPHTDYTQGCDVNAIGYPVTFSVNGFGDATGNYVFTAQDGNITVVPRKIEFYIDPVYITYGDTLALNPESAPVKCDLTRLVGSDTLKSITSNGSDPVFTYICDYDSYSNKNVGRYDITLQKTFDSSANYEVTFKTGYLYVEKAPLTIQGNSKTVVYNSDIPALDGTMYTLNGCKGSDTAETVLSDCELKVTTTYVKGSPVSAAGYPVNITLDTSGVTNYSVTVKPGSITVIKADPRITAAPTAEITHGEKLADAVFTGETIADGVSGTFRFDQPDMAPVYQSSAYHYSATFIPADSVNYNPVTGLSITLTVNRRLISGSLAVTGNPMIGASGSDNYLYADVSGLDPDSIGSYTFEWYDDENLVASGSSLKLVEAYKLKSIKLVATAHEPYIGTAEYTTTTIAPYLEHNIADEIKADKYSALFTLSGLDSFGGTTELTYNAFAHDVLFSKRSDIGGSAVIGDITVKYNGSTTAPTKAGTYKITVDVATPDLSRVSEEGVTVYSPAVNIEIGKLVINPAQYSVEINIADKVYDGSNAARIASVNPLAPITAPSGEPDDVSFDSANAAFVFADNANAGNGKKVTGSGALIGSSSENYELIITNAETMTANITPKELDVTVIPVSRAYEADKLSVMLGFSVDKSTLAPTDSADDVYVDQTNAFGTVDNAGAGTRSVTVGDGIALAGAKAANYTLNIVNRDSATVKIEKAVPSYPMPELEALEFDAGRTLADVDLGDSRWSWKSEYANVIPQAGTHTYTAVFTPADTKNYLSVEKEMTFEVTPKTVYIEAASFTVVYGSKEPYYSYTITGLTGSDSQKELFGYVIPSCAYTSSSDVGSYDVVLTGGFSSTNYTFINKKGTVTVAPKTVYVEALPVSREYVPGRTDVEIKFSDITGVNAVDADNVYILGNSAVGTVPNDAAGIKTVQFTLPELTGSKAGNYKLALLNSEVRVEILKAHIQGVTLPQSGTVKFGQRLSTTKFDAGYTGGENGTFAMENKNSTPAAVGTFSNQYKVVFTPNDTVNYASESAYITLTVERADLAVELSILGSPEIDKKLAVSAGNVPSDAVPYIVYKWYRVSDPNDDVKTGTPLVSGVSEYTVKDADAGSFIVCVADNATNSPYSISGRAATASSVVKPATSLWQKIVAWFYRLIAAMTQLFGGMK